MTWLIVLDCVLWVLNRQIMSHFDAAPWVLPKESNCDMKSNEHHYNFIHRDSLTFTTETYIEVLSTSEYGFFETLIPPSIY